MKMQFPLLNQTLTTGMRKPFRIEKEATMPKRKKTTRSLKVNSGLVSTFKNALKDKQMVFACLLIVAAISTAIIAKISYDRKHQPQTIVQAQLPVSTPKANV